MPTAAKLFAAVALAVVGFFAAALVLPHLPGGARADFLPLMAASVGILVGWRVIGRATGRGYGSSAQAGVRGALYLVLWVLALTGFMQMVKMALRMRYDAPTEALVDVVSQAMDFGELVLKPDVLLVLFVGGGLAGMVSEWAGRRWL